MAWQCPICKSTDLIVAVTTYAKLVQHNDDEFETEAEGDHEWDGTSNMTCTSCAHCDASSAFEVDQIGTTTIHCVAPAAASYARGERVTLVQAGIETGFYLNEQGRIQNYHGIKTPHTVLKIEGRKGPVTVVHVTSLDNPEKSWESPFYRSGGQVLAAMEQARFTCAEITPNTLELPDAIRMATLNVYGSSFQDQQQTELYDHADEVMTKAMGMAFRGVGVDLCALSPECVLDLTPIKQVATIAIPDTKFAETPTLVRFYYGSWITYAGKHYSIDCPEGVADLHDLAIFRWACVYADCLGYKIETSRGLLDVTAITR